MKDMFFLQCALNPILAFHSLTSTIEVAFSIDHFLSHSQVASCFDTEERNTNKERSN